jgi:acyl-CoA thioester hydrolase
MNEFQTTLELRIDWSEVDIFRHVNNVAFFKYIQAARVRYNDLVGVSEGFLETGIAFMVAESSCTFKKPLNFPGYVNIATRCEWIKNTSFGLHHSLMDVNDEVVAEGRDVIVYYDFNLNTKLPLTDYILHRLNMIKFQEEDL